MNQKIKKKMKKISLYAGTNYNFNNLYNFIKNLYVIIIGKFIKKFNQQEILYKFNNVKYIKYKKINKNIVQKINIFIDIYLRIVIVEENKEFFIYNE